MKWQLTATAIAMYAIAAFAQTTDSPLVAAARVGAEARRKAALEGRVVVTNDMLKSNRVLSTSSSQADVGKFVAFPPPPSPPPASRYAAPPSQPAIGYTLQSASDPRLPRESNTGSVSSMPAASQSAGAYRPPQ